MYLDNFSDSKTWGGEAPPRLYFINIFENKNFNFN